MPKNLFVLTIAITFFVCSPIGHKNSKLQESDSFYTYTFRELGLPKKYLDPNPGWLTKLRMKNSFMQYYSKVVQPFYNNSVLPEIIKRNEKKLVHLFERNGLFRTHFYNSLIDYWHHLFYKKTQGQQKITLLEAEKFKAILLWIRELASPQFQSDLDILIEWCNFLPGEKLHETLPYLAKDNFVFGCPIENELLFSGEQYNIEWTPNKKNNLVNIYLDTGKACHSIAENTENDGHFEWIVPDLEYNFCRLIIHSADRCYKTKSKTFAISHQTSERIINEIYCASPEHTVDVSTASSAIQINFVNKYYETVPITSQNRTVTLTSSSPTGEFSMQQNPFIPIKSVQLDSNISGFTFYYRDSIPGYHNLKISESPDKGWIDGQQKIHVANMQRYELENHYLIGRKNRYTIANASKRGCIFASKDTTKANFSNNEKRGFYKIIAHYADEETGNSRARLETVFSYDDRKGEYLKQWQLNDTKPGEGLVWRDKNLGVFRLWRGQKFILKLIPDSLEQCLVDYIGFVKLDTINHLNPDNFTINITTNKTEYMLGEPVWVTVRVENLGKVGPDIVHSDVVERLHVSDSTGQIFDPMISWSRIGHRYMKKDQIINVTENIQNFDVKMKQNQTGVEYYNLPVGTYQISEIINGVKSNIVEINISSPEGEIATELEAYNKISKADYKIYKLQEGRHKRYKIFQDLVLDFVHNFPQSIYADYAMFRLILKIDYCNPNDVAGIFNNFYSYFQDSEYMENIVGYEYSYYSQHLKDEKRAIDAMKNIIDQNFSEKATNRARIMLKRRIQTNSF